MAKVTEEQATSAVAELAILAIHGIMPRFPYDISKEDKKSIIELQSILYKFIAQQRKKN